MNWKIRENAKQYIKEEIEKTKRYKSNIEDDVIPGKGKRYVKLSQKKAKIWFRARTDLLDPAPRQPYNPVNIWKCKFCDITDQSTEHYIKECEATRNLMEELNREHVHTMIKTLEGNEQTFYRTTQILTKIYEKINK